MKVALSYRTPQARPTLRRTTLLASQLVNHTEPSTAILQPNKESTQVSGDSASPYIDGDPLRLRVGTAWTEIVIQSEVRVLYTRRGYAPVVWALRGQLEHILFVSASSLSEPLEQLRQRRGYLSGVRVRVRKTGEAPTSPYQLEVLEE